MTVIYSFCKTPCHLHTLKRYYTSYNLYYSHNLLCCTCVFINDHSIQYKLQKFSMQQLAHRQNYLENACYYCKHASTSPYVHDAPVIFTCSSTSLKPMKLYWSHLPPNNSSLLRSFLNCYSFPESHIILHPTLYNVTSQKPTPQLSKLDNHIMWIDCIDNLWMTNVDFHEVLRDASLHN